MPVEVESLNGYLQMLGREQGIPTPETDKLIAEVNAMIAERDAGK